MRLVASVSLVITIPLAGRRRGVRVLLVMVVIVLAGVCSAIRLRRVSFSQLLIRLGGQIIRILLGFIIAAIKRAWIVFPRPGSSAIKVWFWNTARTAPIV